MKYVSINTTTNMILDELKSRGDRKNRKVKMILDTDNDRLSFVGKHIREIDGIEARFSNQEGFKNEPGKLSLAISVLGGTRFVPPYLSVVPFPKPGEKIDCIEFYHKRSSTVLIVNFLEPEKNQHLDYPNLYFHTSEGIVDPSVSITRGVGG